MRRILMIAGLAAAVAAPTLLPSAASAQGYCEQRAHDRRVTGTLLGAVGGGLLGNAVSSGGGRTGGTLIGAGLGAVVGNNLARTSCDRPRAYYRRPVRSRSYRSYSSYGPGPAGRYAGAPAACHYETRPFYDARGRLVYSPTQVCG
ncbi:MAG: putative outer rane lipoprotein SlyB precursor [Phenylobacterium sp.]|nr:putative outer rane lipoprotein SlyB precursor [Phenylobacterium sp.]